MTLLTIIIIIMMIIMLFYLYGCVLIEYKLAGLYHRTVVVAAVTLQALVRWFILFI